MTGKSSASTAVGGELFERQQFCFAAVQTCPAKEFEPTNPNGRLSNGATHTMCPLPTLDVFAPTAGMWVKRTVA